MAQNIFYFLPFTLSLIKPLLNLRLWMAVINCMLYIHIRIFVIVLIITLMLFSFAYLRHARHSSLIVLYTYHGHYFMFVLSFRMPCAKIYSTQRFFLPGFRGWGRWPLTQPPPPSRVTFILHSPSLSLVHIYVRTLFYVQPYLPLFFMSDFTYISK